MRGNNSDSEEEQQLEAAAAEHRQIAADFRRRAAIIQQNRNLDEWEARTVTFLEGGLRAGRAQRQRQRGRGQGRQQGQRRSQSVPQREQQGVQVPQVQIPQEAHPPQGAADLIALLAQAALREVVRVQPQLQVNPHVMAAQGALAGANQLNAIPLYSGDVGAPEVQDWLDTVEMVRTSFNWNDGVTLATVRARLTGKALHFVWNLQATEEMPPIWADVAGNPALAGPPPVAAVPPQVGLATLLRERFRTDRGIGGVADALSKLIQKPNEGVLDFYDRCVRTHGKLNADTPNRQDPVYQATLARSIYFSYLGGMRQDIKGPIMQRPIKPQTAVELRIAAIDVEASNRPARVIQAVELDEAVGGASMEELQQKLEELKALSGSVEAVIYAKSARGGKKKAPGAGSRGGAGRPLTGREGKKCFYCEKLGHFEADCFAKKNQERTTGGKNTRGTGARRKQTRGGARGSKRWVAYASCEYDDDGKGFVFQDTDAKPCQEPSKEAENE